MKWDLKTPCKNCPFRTDDTATRFACRERAEEIEESAYRHGFPCHLSAIYVEETAYDEGGFVMGPDTQHCAGATIMYLKGDCGNVPFERLSDDEQETITERLDWDAPVFVGAEDFLDSYEPTQEGKDR